MPIIKIFQMKKKKWQENFEERMEKCSREERLHNSLFLLVTVIFNKQYFLNNNCLEIYLSKILAENDEQIELDILD